MMTASYQRRANTITPILIAIRAERAAFPDWDIHWQRTEGGEFAQTDSESQLFRVKATKRLLAMGYTAAQIAFTLGVDKNAMYDIAQEMRRRLREQEVVPPSPPPSPREPICTELRRAALEAYR